MTYRLKFATPALKMKVATRIPAQLVGGTGITLTKSNGVYTFDLDYSEFSEIASFDPSAKDVLVFDAGLGTFDLVSLAGLLTNTSLARVVTEAGDITVGVNTQLLIMNRTADESPSNIILPSSASKVGAVKIVDWKGNAGSFPHTVTPNGSETFNGAAATWTIGGDGASSVFTPASTLGYAV